MTPAKLVEALLSEIAIAGQKPDDDYFYSDDPSDSGASQDVKDLVQRQWEQEQLWYQIANENGITEDDLHNIARPFVNGLTQREVDHYKHVAYKELVKQNGVR